MRQHDTAETLAVLESLFGLGDIWLASNEPDRVSFEVVAYGDDVVKVSYAVLSGLARYFETTNIACSSVAYLDGYESGCPTCDFDSQTRVVFTVLP